MKSLKLFSSDTFPEMKLKTINGVEVSLGRPQSPFSWQMIIVYRGQHCPLCTKYLEELTQLQGEFEAEGVELLAISADTLDKAIDHTQNRLNLKFKVGYDLTIDQMQELGLYISKPRNENETDRPFAEPGLFIVNEEFKLHVVDISNNPFVRPDLKTLLSGIKWIRNPKNNYPIRGTYN